MNKKEEYYRVTIDKSVGDFGSYEMLTFLATSNKDARDKAKAYIAASLAVNSLNMGAKNKIESVYRIGD